MRRPYRRLRILRLTASDRASLDTADGSVLVGGRLTCARPLWVYISGELVQKFRGRSLRGFFGTSLWCSGTTTWSAPAETGFQRVRGIPLTSFSAGAALLNVSATAYDEETGIGARRGLRRTVRVQATR